MRLSASLALGFAIIAAGSPIFKNIERSVQKNGLGERGVSEKNPDSSTGSHSPHGKPVPEEGHPSGHPSGHPPAPSGPSWPNFGNKTEPACSSSGSFSFQPLPSEFPTASFPHDSLPSEFPPVSFPTESLPPVPSASEPFPTEVPSEIPFPVHLLPKDLTSPSQLLPVWFKSSLVWFLPSSSTSIWPCPADLYVRYGSSKKTLSMALTYR